MQAATGVLDTDLEESPVLTATLTESAVRLFVWPVRTDGMLWLHYQPGGAGAWIPMAVREAITPLAVKSGDKVKLSFSYNGDPAPAPKNYRLEIA